MEIFLSIAVPLPCPFPHKVSFSFLLFWFILLFLFANINNSYTYVYPFLPHCYTEDRILDIPFYTLCFLLNNISGDHSVAVTFHVSFYSWRVFHCVNGPQLIQPVSSLSDGHLDWFQPFVISDNATMNKLAHKSLQHFFSQHIFRSEYWKWDFWDKG